MLGERASFPESEMQSAAFQSWRYLYHQAGLCNYLDKLGMHFLCATVLAFFFLLENLARIFRLPLPLERDCWIFPL